MEKIKRVKVEYNMDDGGIYEPLEKDIITLLESKYELVYDGSGMELETRTRDLYFYAKE